MELDRTVILSNGAHQTRRYCDVACMGLLAFRFFQVPVSAILLGGFPELVSIEFVIDI